MPALRWQTKIAGILFKSFGFCMIDEKLTSIKKRGRRNAATLKSER
jgi:hypothetical protein